MRPAKAVAAAAVPVVALAGCGGGKPANGPETTELKVGTLPIVDDAPFYIARRDGLFAKQHLKVRPVTLTSGSEAVVRLESGGVDVSLTSYPVVLNAVASGVVKLRVLLDAYATVPHLFPVLALPSSPIRGPGDLTGRTIAVNTQKGLGPLLLSAAGIRLANVKMTEMPFPNMAAALQSRAVDAIWVTEPFATQTKQKTRAREVVDSSGGAADGIPIAGYSASARTVAREPKALAAFRRAMAQAQRIAQDRRQVEKILPTYVRGLTPQVASHMVLGHFATGTDPAKLQRTADLMRKYGLLKRRLDVRTLLPAGLPG